MADGANSNILFEMLRSFTTLARTLNLSKAVRELKSTRQTVRRHIDILEKARGKKLFELNDRQYRLTKIGERSIPDAEIILARGNAWLSGQLEHIGKLQTIKIDNQTSSPDSPVFYSQQHPLSGVWRDGTPLLRFGLDSWMKARGEVEGDAFASVRPYWIIFRKLEQKWVCVEIGEKSALATWFGLEWTKSSLGSYLEETPLGPDLGDFISQAYNDVFESGGPRLDHQFRHVPRIKNGTAVPISFQRLLLPCTFPDGSFALVTLSDRTYNLNISGVTEEQIRTMPTDLEMKFKVPKIE